MTKTYHNIFISSKNRLPTESVADFTVNFQAVGISCKENQYLSINVISFEMLNSMFNVNSISKNNTFTLSINSTDTTRTIPFGNYSVYTLRDTLNSLLSGIINVSYNPAQNSYTFKKIIADANNYFITPNSTNKLLGFNTKTLIPVEGYTGNFINMVNYSKIILRVGNLNFDYFTYENIRDPKDAVVENSDILAMFSKQDVEPFKMIRYDNIDASKSFHYKLFNKDLDFIELSLTNENNELITDASDYILILQVIINNKEMDLVISSVNKILNIITDIKTLILLSLKYFGFFNDINNF